MSDMEYITYKMIEISKLNSGGDRPKIYSDTKTNECCFPIFSNGLQDEGLYGYTNKATMPSDTITVSARGANIGEVFYRKEVFLPIVRLITIIPDSNYVHSKYLYYYLKKVKIEGSGSAQPQITVPFFSRHKIVIPKDVEYQKKVAYILSAYDNLIENNNKRIKLLEQMAENLYKEWFVRFRFPGYEDTEFENGIPKGWKIERLSDIADIIMGQSPKSENYNTNCEGLPFHQGVGSYGDFYLIDNIYSTKGNRIAEANSIIFSVRAPVGRINITLNKIILGRGVASINSVKGYNAYLLWMLKNQFQQEDIIGNGSIFTSVTKKELFGFKILLPHDDLIQKFDSIAFGIESEMRKLSLINDNLTKQRDLLLPRLMSGKLEV